jgi:hypothetical protein
MRNSAISLNRSTLNELRTKSPESGGLEKTGAELAQGQRRLSGLPQTAFKWASRFL